MVNVGITGHQNLGTADTAHWVVLAIKKVVTEIAITQGFTSLAIGTDQLFANIMVEKAIPFIVVVPCTKIELSFKSDKDTALFRQLLAQAKGILRLPFDEPSEEAYFEAGKTVVDKSDLLIAVWDGQPAKGLGGTGDVVHYALKNKKEVIHVDLEARKVNQIHSPEQ